MKRTPIQRHTPLRPKKPWRPKYKPWNRKPQELSEKTLRNVLAVKKTKKDPYWLAVRRADKWFSLYIRYKARDRNDIVRCVTCGRFGDPKEFDAGHYIGRRHMETRYDERNVHVQCKNCNGNNEGEKDEYAYFLLKTYGADVLEELNRAKHTVADMDTYQLNLIADEYRQKFKAL